MVQTSDTHIQMIRGDTLYIHVTISLNGDEYIPQEGDAVRFAMKHDRMTAGNKAYVDAKPLLVKDIPINTMMLKFDPADTKPFPFGAYAYDIQITFANGDVDTFITGVLEIMPEVD